jgi:hypothetical protein
MFIEMEDENVKNLVIRLPKMFRDVVPKDKKMAT